MLTRILQNVGEQLRGEVRNLELLGRDALAFLERHADVREGGEAQLVEVVEDVVGGGVAGRGGGG